ncbi:transglycosylase [Novimethylophilus kurashikiensis]|uniref:Transglycosylase n=1 Tax=Novimethylophilus kurashikiensis TaxID=1825523 RepID=A0A2R5F8N3_9PROT|nr:lytic transglycosylase domain-containing protein [Novimethylophilus kurashikiensis]GBG14395.1 transglycosylase [Novimethylophilus kurashikiensis]
MFWVSAELPPEIPTTCVMRAAQHYSVPVAALLSILKQEGGEVGKAYVRSTGTYFGPFQISDTWTGHFQKWGISSSKLQHDACANAVAGAYVLAYYKAREPDWYRAIARYNVGSLNTPQRRDAGFRYASKVMHHWWGIYEKWNHPT